MRSIGTYNKFKFPFATLVMKHVANANVTRSQHRLELLHEYVDQDMLPSSVVTVKNDQDTKIHAYLYEIDPAFGRPNAVDVGFIKTYREFVQSLCNDVFQEAVVYQRLPTFRVHLPNNLSVGAYHTDSEYNHPIEEVNIWVPLTNTRETNSIYIESSPGKGDFEAMQMIPGQYMMFDSRLKHGNELNSTGETRISFDFRIIRASEYQSSELRSVSKGRQFVVGDYYDIMQPTGHISDR
jgi:hypothetical protein